MNFGAAGRLPRSQPPGLIDSRGHTKWMGVAQPSICAGHSMLCPYEFTQGARVRNAVHLSLSSKCRSASPRGLSPRASRRKGEAGPAATSFPPPRADAAPFQRGYEVSRLSQSERILDKPHPAAYKPTVASANEYYVLMTFERSATRPDCFSFGDWAAYSEPVICCARIWCGPDGAVRAPW